MAKTLRLLNCINLGLEMGDTLVKITDNVFETPFENEIAHIVTDHGKIICSILNSKNGYEASLNADRRKNNVEKGFLVFWDDEGRDCTVYRRIKEKSKMAARFMAMLFCIMGAAITATLFICLRPSTHRIEDNATQTELTWERTEQLKEQWGNYATILLSTACTEYTVNEIADWYNRLSTNEQEFLNGTVDPVESAIEVYRMFFNANDISDLVELMRNYSGFFNEEQRNVIIYGYGQSPYTFENWKNNFGMSFSEPFVRSLMDGYQWRDSYVKDRLGN